MSGQRRRKVFMVAVLGRNLIVLNIAWVTGQDIIKASKVEIFFFRQSTMVKKQPESAKNKAAKRSKQADDKTFGLKNKNKSSKVQAFVKQVEEQAKSSGAAAKKKEADAARRAAEKKAAEAAKAEARALFSQAITPQKVPFGVDPKSVLCAFFKQGLCNKGSKCKFSHDLNVERKAVKKDLYSDERTDKESDTMDNWDDEKLANVVMSKHGNPKTTTDIICKYFIEAIENSKYGWFWVCPNGGDNCKYRHSLPPGFKLKTKEEQRLERAAAANEPKMTLEDFIEIERKKLPKNLTPVTLESFTKWKTEREAKKLAEREEAQKKAKGPMSGRQLMDSGKFVADEEDQEDWDFTAMRAETLALEQAAEDAAEEAAREEAERARLET
ncbi:Translation machinery-associated protein 46 [Wickerhamiella sorbophila]|uniref:Zinc finger CCCH domain-containing protein 15 n=1 Tax=Wickerhamiella sorbophila TaxID=45607 RepID=A0A2T0FGG2_9ASCO|nr:Translation machinery-associated protein 46 [Wickerhamiella sorbophila]PRT54092.1 Translation machinery-associated protein 46 [Wickerhamiella sorbophila]